MNKQNQYSWIKTSEVIGLFSLLVFFPLLLVLSSKDLAMGFLFGSALSLLNIRVIRYMASQSFSGGGKLPWSFWAISLGKFYLLAISLFILIVIFNLDGLGFMIGYGWPLAVLTVTGAYYYKRFESPYPISG